jgi:predicted transcriptional regulator
LLNNIIWYSTSTAKAVVSSIDATNINLSWSGSWDALDYTIFCLA